jgi:hypothetical protein
MNELSTMENKGELSKPGKWKSPNRQNNSSKKKWLLLCQLRLHFSEETRIISPTALTNRSLLNRELAVFTVRYEIIC